MLDSILKKINSFDLKIGILGLGYVGLPLALRFDEVGFPVVGLDTNTDKVSELNEGRSTIKHISDESIQKALTNRLTISGEFSLVRDLDVVIICVPTPLTPTRDPDLSYVDGAIETILPFLRRGQALVLESTTYPGTTDELIKPRIQELGYVIGEEFFLLFSPEREDPGNGRYSTKTIPKVVGGVTENCLRAGCAIYASIIDNIVPVSSTRAAEMTKLLENIHRAVNIGLVNEMKMICDAMNIDIYEVIRAASSKPFGFAPYYPGPGVGGHCIPIDPYYLSWKAREYDLNSKFIELAGEINHQMPEWVFNKLVHALNIRNKAVSGSRILVLGVAYKKNIDDSRDSPAVRIIDLIQLSLGTVDFFDPFIESIDLRASGGFTMNRIKFEYSMLRSYDAVVIATDHDDLDYKLVLKESQLIIDTRGVFQYPSNKIVVA